MHGMHAPVDALLEDRTRVPNARTHTAWVCDDALHTRRPQAPLQLVSKQHVGELGVLVEAAAPVRQERLRSDDKVGTWEIGEAMVGGWVTAVRLPFNRFWCAGP
jgi:hypothetical protein